MFSQNPSKIQQMPHMRRRVDLFIYSFISKPVKRSTKTGRTQPTRTRRLIQGVRHALITCSKSKQEQPTQAGVLMQKYLPRGSHSVFEGSNHHLVKAPESVRKYSRKLKN